MTMGDELMDAMELDAKLDKYEQEGNVIGLMRLVAQQQYNTNCTCHQMTTHLKELNGTVKENRTHINEIRYKQNMVLSRVWSAMPTWLQISLIVLLAGTLADIGFIIKFLS